MKNQQKKKVISIASILICGCKHQFNDIGLEFLPDWDAERFEKMNLNYEKYTCLPFRGYKVSRCIYCGLLQKVNTGITTTLPINPTKIKKQVLSMNLAKKKYKVGLDFGKVGEHSAKVVINGTDIDCK